jgi:tRNA modification GTPase
MNRGNTIAAIATAPGRGAIGIVRLSGQDLSGWMEGLLGRRLPPRRAVLSEFHGAGAEVIDQGIALYFPGPHSYTGEDVLELQSHGGPVLLRLLLKRCVELGARIAEPGEFTKRAYLHDKLDLAQAEAVADLIDASTAQAARSALRSLRGAFSQQIAELDRELLELRTLVEATLDFPDEEVDFLKQADAQGRVDRLREGLSRILAASRQGSLLREGLQVVLAGRPNVGKSSLLNRLAGEDLVIVTPIPGTTRDAVRVSVDIGGMPVHFTDTAGLRESQDVVERLGIDRSWEAIKGADAVLLMMDAGAGVTDGDDAIRQRIPIAVPCIAVMNKIDLTARKPGSQRKEGGRTIWLSALTGAGVDLLHSALLEVAGWQDGGEGLFMARQRHLQALEAAQAHVERALGVTGRLELLAEELRLAREALGAITGECTPDDLLGEIFSRFCIGK